MDKTKKGVTHCSTKLSSAVWTLAHNAHDSRVAGCLSLKLATFLSGHYRICVQEGLIKCFDCANDWVNVASRVFVWSRRHSQREGARYGSSDGRELRVMAFYSDAPFCRDASAWVAVYHDTDRVTCQSSCFPSSEHGRQANFCLSCKNRTSWQCVLHVLSGLTSHLAACHNKTILFFVTFVCPQPMAMSISSILLFVPSSSAHYNSTPPFRYTTKVRLPDALFANKGYVTGRWPLSVQASMNNEHRSLAAGGSLAETSAPKHISPIANFSRILLYFCDVYSGLLVKSPSWPCDLWHQFIRGLHRCFSFSCLARSSCLRCSLHPKNNRNRLWLKFTAPMLISIPPYSMHLPCNWVTWQYLTLPNRPIKLWSSYPLYHISWFHPVVIFICHHPTKNEIIIASLRVYSRPYAQ